MKTSIQKAPVDLAFIIPEATELLKCRLSYQMWSAGLFKPEIRTMGEGG